MTADKTATSSNTTTQEKMKETPAQKQDLRLLMRLLPFITP